MISDTKKRRLDMVIRGFNLGVSLSYNNNGSWESLDWDGDNTWSFADSKGLHVKLFLSEEDGHINYELKLDSIFETQIRLQLSLDGEEDLFHLIPCNIHGDNNIENAQLNEYPILKTGYDHISCSPFWEFRADRSSNCASILCCRNGAVGIFIEPYSNAEEGRFIRNGVFVGLPDKFGVSLGYSNYPVTYVNKRTWAEPTNMPVKRSGAKGAIYAFRGNGRQMAHNIVREIYYNMREKPDFHKTYEEAAKGLFNSFLTVNWSEEYQNYSNQKCRVPEDAILKPWRPLVEIGWTGGGIIAYSLLAAQYALGLDSSCYQNKKSPHVILEEIVSCYNEKSGLLNDITKPYSPKSSNPVNGWWAGFGIANDCHCAYTNGSALFYLFKCIVFLKEHYGEEHDDWIKIGVKVLDTVIGLQREDGAFGYTYSRYEKKVLDWDGFAGCWFTAACAYVYKLVRNKKYLDAADRSIRYYLYFVDNLNCWGTPMDTWKSVDEEGNLAFIKAAKLMHELTGEEEYLDMLESGISYDYLWKYCFRARPEYPPLKDSPWNSCGGPVTSISNPHIHPMGMIVASDIKYLAEKTGDVYHKMRWEDTISWAMNTLELYPDITGYGRYGVMTERYCPSDGLTIENYSNGAVSSLWFSYNGWAAANTMEAIAEIILNRR